MNDNAVAMIGWALVILVGIIIIDYIMGVSKDDNDHRDFY